MTATNQIRTVRLPRCLVVVAAPVEAEAVLRASGVTGYALERWTPVQVSRRCDAVMCGIGKVNAAACVARLLDGRYGVVLSVGLCGALPGGGLSIGQSVLADRCVYSDEGMVTPDGFRDCGQMGFPMGAFVGGSVPTDKGVFDRLRMLVDRAGPVATVSTCSGTDAAAAEVVTRTGAIAEAMEGAAVAHVATELGVACGELRVVSNTTGNRAAQRWDIPRAVETLVQVLGRVLPLV